MTWRVDSRTDTQLWVTGSATGWDADPDSKDRVGSIKNGPLALTPVGPYYEPTGPDDETAVFIAAISVVPAPAVSGSPPAVPTIADLPIDGAVY